MRTLVISDIHLRHRQIDTVLGWEEPYDRAIFLGDYLDQWSDTPEQNAETATWLKAKLEDPRNVMLIGNHDQGYMWAANQWAHCSGFDERKAWAVNRIMTEADWGKLKIYHAQDGILFSHAGIDPGLFTVLAAGGFEFPRELTLEAITAWLDQTWPQVVERYRAGSIHPLMEAGANRGGLQRIGGITWQDFYSHTPLTGIGQIVGHTVVNVGEGPLFRLINRNGAPMWRLAAKGLNPRWLKEGWTLGLDTNSRHYLVLDGQTITVKAVRWHRPHGEHHYLVAPGGTIAQIHLKEPNA